MSVERGKNHSFLKQFSIIYKYRWSEDQTTECRSVSIYYWATVKYKSVLFVRSLLLDSAWSPGQRQKVKSTSVPGRVRNW